MENKKVSEISYCTNPNKDDYVNFLNLLGLYDIIKNIEEGGRMIRCQNQNVRKNENGRFENRTKILMEK